MEDFFLAKEGVFLLLDLLEVCLAAVLTEPFYVASNVRIPHSP